MKKKIIFSRRVSKEVYPNMSLIPYKNEIPVTLMLIPTAGELEKKNRC